MERVGHTHKAPPVARRIRGLMAEHGLTQAEVGNLLGLSQGAVSRRLVGQVNFRDTEIAAIAHHVGTTPDRLTERAA